MSGLPISRPVRPVDDLHAVLFMDVDPMPILNDPSAFGGLS